MAKPNIRSVTMSQVSSYIHILFCFETHLLFWFCFAWLGFLAVKAAVGSSDDGGKRQKMRLFCPFFDFFYLSRHQRDHINLNTFLAVYCKVHFPGKSADFRSETADFRSQESGRRAYIKPCFFFFFFIPFFLKLFYFLLELTSLHFTLIF